MEEKRNGYILGYELAYKLNTSGSEFTKPESTINPMLCLSVNHRGHMSRVQSSVVKKLLKFTEYCFGVRAKTSAGAGPYTNALCVKTKEDGKSNFLEQID